ncbi:MAG: flagellin [Eubacterium sp.]|nr:flagellin [Eubacterium sp.]
MAISSISNQNLRRNYQSLSSGKRINKAADDAAALAIAQKLLSQKNGYDSGYRNAGTSKDMLNVEDGALSSITDNLQRIRELGVQASNFMYTASDRGAIQAEIDQLKQSISDTASQTQFNKMNILDGSMSSSHVAAGPNGGGLEIHMPNSALEALGIADFDVTSGDFDLSVIDDAIDKVSSQRSSMGASSNRLDSVMAYNANASYHLTASQSRLEDLDYPKAVSDLKKNQLLETFQVMMRRKHLENENGRVMQLYRS